MGSRPNPSRRASITTLRSRCRRTASSTCFVRKVFAIADRAPLLHRAIVQLEYRSMQTYPALIACVNCDTISERPALARGQQACCAACGAVLLRSGLNVRQLLALALAAAVVFVIANVYPVIGIGLYGEHHRTTLLGSALSLADSRAAPIAIVVVMAIVVLPALQIAVLCWLLLFARAGRRAPLFGVLMRAWEQLNPWSMVEV